MLFYNVTCYNNVLLRRNHTVGGQNKPKKRSLVETLDRWIPPSDLHKDRNRQVNPRPREPPPQDQTQGGFHRQIPSNLEWGNPNRPDRSHSGSAPRRRFGWRSLGSLSFTGDSFFPGGPWEAPVSFSIHAIAISSHSPAITPLGPSQLAPTDRHSLSPFSSPISPDAITSWINWFSVFNSAGIKLKDGTGRLKSRASPWLYVC